MKWGGETLAVLTVGAFYLSTIEQRSEYALQLIELESQIGVKLWIPLAILSVLAFFLQRRNKGVNHHKTHPHPRQDWPERPKPHKEQPMNAKVPIDEDWRASCMQKIDGLQFPIGTKIIIDPGEGIPFELRMDRSTPEMVRQSLATFARFIDSIPTPSRVKITYLDVIPSGIPHNNQVMGAFRKYQHAENLMIRAYESEVDVRFLFPDPCWESNQNLNKTF